MNEGANILKGRNNNQLVLDKEGGVTLSTGTSLILVNTNKIPTSPPPSPSITSTYIITDLKMTPTKSIVEEPVTDIIPFYYPKDQGVNLSNELITDTSSFLLPSTEEDFTIELYESIGIEYIDPSIIKTEEVIYSGPNFKSKGSLASKANFMTDAEQTSCDRNIIRNKTFVDGFLINSPTRRYEPVGGSSYHGAFDIATPVGKSIKFKVPSDLASGGIILHSVLYPTQNKGDFVAGSGGYGILVILRYHNDKDGKDYYIYLAHLQKVSDYINNLPVNSVINQNEIIAYTGDTAWKNEKTGPHLHFEVREGPSKHICPYNFIPYLELK